MNYFQPSGTGTLGVPFAVMQGGYMSLVAIVIISVITNYTGKLIIECLYEKPFNGQGARGVRTRNSYALIGKVQRCRNTHCSHVDRICLICCYENVEYEGDLCSHDHHLRSGGNKA